MAALYVDRWRNRVVISINTCVCVCVNCLVDITWGLNNTPKIQAQQLCGNQGRPTWLQVFAEVLNKLRVTEYEAVSPHASLAFV